MLPEILAPFIFHTPKHHLGVLQMLIKNYLPEQQAELVQVLKRIGASQMDVYEGKLSATEICNELGALLAKQNQLEEHAFLSLLEPSGFYACETSDGARWVLRRGDIPNHYVHIHPARYSPHTFRAKAGALRTALAWMCFCPKQEIKTSAINFLRSRWLDLSPVKDVQELDGFQSILKKLNLPE
ncbi:MAG: hypothetical protein ACRCYO_14910 [Bacteroidia bacterium]